MLDENCFMELALFHAGRKCCFTEPTLSHAGHKDHTSSSEPTLFHVGWWDHISTSELTLFHVGRWDHISTLKPTLFHVVRWDHMPVNDYPLLSHFVILTVTRIESINHQSLLRGTTPSLSLKYPNFTLDNGLVNTSTILSSMATY